MVGGDITEITYNHPILGSGSIFPMAGEDNTFDIGGMRSNDDDNMVDGSGNMIVQLSRVRWSVETSISWDMNNSDELGKLVQLASSPVQADWTFTHVNGTVWGGKGKPVGDLKGNGKAATMSLKIAGGGSLKKIVG